MYIYIYIHINICHSRYCPSRKKEKEFFLVEADDDDDDVFCFLCFRLVMTNIVVDFSSFIAMLSIDHLLYSSPAGFLS